MTRLFSILDGIGDNSACGLLQVHLEKVMFATTVFFGDGLQDGSNVYVCVLGSFWVLQFPLTSIFWAVSLCIFLCGI